MNAKKLLLLILSLCLALCLVACGDDTIDGFEKPDGDGYKPDGGYNPDDDGREEHTTHVFGSWEVENSPTQEMGGSLIRRCEGCPETETSPLPALNNTDYRIVNAWYPDEPISCKDSYVYAQFYYTFNDPEQGSYEICVATTDYQPEHPEVTENNYTVWTTENHYVACSVCGGAITDIFEAHTMENNECTVCHYVPDSLVYDDDSAYVTGVSYSANEESVVIPSIYGGSIPEKAGFIVSSIYSFKDNNNLNSITIPATIDFMGADAFQGCTSLTSVYYEGTWADWCDIRFTNDLSNPMYYASDFYMRDENGEWAKVTDIVIPDTVTAINDYSFVGFVNINSITIPKTITKLGSSAFCTDISSCHYKHAIVNEEGFLDGYTCDFGKVYYGGSVEDWFCIEFGKYTRMTTKTSELYFYENGSYVPHTSITEVELPVEVTVLEDFAFFGFTALERFKSLGALTDIGEYSFYRCPELVSVDLRAGCKKIDRSAFEGCVKLDTIHLPKDLEMIYFGAFYEVDSIDNVYYDGTIEDWCGIVFTSQFYGNSIDVSTPMRSGKSNFHMLGKDGGYYSIYETNTFPTGTGVNLYNYFLVIPESVKEIGAYQFYGFDLDESVNVIVVFEGDVTSIGEYAFANAKVDYLYIPKSLTKIDTNAFEGSTDTYTSIYYEGTATEWASVSITTPEELAEVNFHYYADSADKVGGDNFWCWGTDGYVYEWVYKSESWVAELTEALSRGNFTP